MTNKFVTKGCCGRTTTTFKINNKITKQLIDFLKQNGYKEHESFTKSGILYMDIKEMIISGQIGNNSISIQCRISNCEQKINDLELYLSQYEKNCLQSS